jgi:hypothetical protein
VRLQRLAVAQWLYVGVAPQSDVRSSVIKSQPELQMSQRPVSKIKLSAHVSIIRICPALNESTCPSLQSIHSAILTLGTTLKYFHRVSSDDPILVVAFDEVSHAG